MNYISIQASLLEGHVKKMNEERRLNNKDAFYHEKEAAMSTLENIKDADQNTYEKYYYLVEEVF